jgi:hypothetical protein
MAHLLIGSLAHSGKMRGIFCDSEDQQALVDEVGYLPMASEGAAALLQVISQRNLKGSIVLTTNRSIASWGQIFNSSPGMPPSARCRSTASPPLAGSSSTGPRSAPPLPSARLPAT